MEMFTAATVSEAEPVKRDTAIELLIAPRSPRQASQFQDKACGHLVN